MSDVTFRDEMIVEWPQDTHTKKKLKQKNKEKSCFIVYSFEVNKIERV